MNNYNMISQFVLKYFFENLTFEKFQILYYKSHMNNCNNGFIFIFSDDKPIGCIFYNQELFEELGRRTEIGFDGTFYVVPSPFYQLWTGKI